MPSVVIPAPSYAQAMLDSHPHQRSFASGMESEGESSIADISTTMTYSDTESEQSMPQSRSMRGLVDSFKSKLHIRPNGHEPAPHRLRETQVLSPTSSIGSRHGSISEGEMTGSELNHTESIYSLSRVSFASRLAQLTSIPLPSASALSARITSQPTAHLAARSLIEAGDQIKIWIRKASDVLQDLDALDDVEWSAAGGRDGVQEVDRAITRFEGLVKVYVISVEELQTRADISTLSDQTLNVHVLQMDEVVGEWQKIKNALKSVKDQVETGLEWEELWNTTLGEVAQELRSLSDLIFEMEEKRHEMSLDDRRTKRDSSIDIDGLTSPTKSSKPASPSRPAQVYTPMTGSAPIDNSKDDSRLLALFARMQPLRAALDFLPMRLSSFRGRAEAMFPSGCNELDARREALEEQWRKLEADANALRKELGEDRWLLVFRNAASQALQMFDSVERTVEKLLNIYISEAHHDKRAASRLRDSYEAKKTHYIPAIDRVLGLIEQGIKDRLSLNGEILRLQIELKRRYHNLQDHISDLDHVVATGTVDSSPQLRDSISTILSSEHSHATSVVDSAHSSPASSVMWSRNSTAGPATPTAGSSRLPKQRRLSNLSTTTSSARLSMSAVKRFATAPTSHTPEPYQEKRMHSFRDFKQPANKPRWSSSGNATTKDFPPLSVSESHYAANHSATDVATPSPRKYTSTRNSSAHLMSPLIAERRAASPNPSMIGTPTTSRRLTYSSLPPRAASAMDTRSASSPARTSTSRFGAPSTPSLLRKPSALTVASTLPMVPDDEAPQTPTYPSSSIPRLSSARRTSNFGFSTPSVASKPVAATEPSGRRSSMATPNRRTSGIAVLVRPGGGADSRLGMRSASVMSMARPGEESAKTRWKY